jgi:hypothetical protein
MNVPMLNLKLQYARIRDELRRAVDEVFESQQFILGPTVESFESDIARYTDTAWAVGVSSGTDALLLSLMALGVGKDDLVITTPFTFFSTASSISRVGRSPSLPILIRSPISWIPHDSRKPSHHWQRKSVEGLRRLCRCISTGSARTWSRWLR